MVLTGSAGADVTGGGGGGAVTFRTADAVALPPGPLACNVYVVALSGNTRWLPPLETAPMPWLISMSEASLTLQRRVADCPRSMVLGSAMNSKIAGAFGGGATSAFGGGGEG